MRPAATVSGSVAAAERRGFAGARAEGKRIGRPHGLSPAAREEALLRPAAGESVSTVARAMGTSR